MLKEDRLEKLKKLEALGGHGFPPWENKGWELVGRLTAIRGHGKLIFADITNFFGKKQLSFKVDKLSDKWPLVELLDIGDFIGVAGEEYVTQAGEPTLDVTDFSLLTKSLRSLPSSWYGFSDVEERYRQRYVDLLMNPEVKKVFEVRSKVVQLLRKKLDVEGFLEVETPVLQPIYGGATAKPFTTHHNALDLDLYLRISDELYLKRLVVGGFDKVYEIGKDFRNEGIDRQHNPEFTMLEFYWAYANYEDLMKFTEKILSEIVFEIKGTYKITWEEKEYDLTPPWPRVTYRDLLLKDSGIDIDVENTEEKLLKALKNKKIYLKLDGVIGYGALLDQFYKEVSRPAVTGPIFLIDHPVDLKPLAKRKIEDPTKSATFQLLIAGYEIMIAYNELNDPIDQKSRWVEEMKLAGEGLEEHQIIDEDYIRALEYGMPPTAGWGMGIDRFTAMLTDQHTIKDTILFPTMRPENDGKTKRQDFDQKFVIVIDASLPEWQIMNTSGHIAAFLGNKMTSNFDTGRFFLSKDGKNLPRNSQYPVVTLSATKDQLSELADKVGESGLLHIYYVPEMMETTDDQKLEGMLAAKNNRDLIYAGIGMFGPKSEIDKLTKNLTLWGKNK